MSRRTSQSDAPLFAWGDALRAARMRRRRMRHAGTGLALAIVALGLTLAFPPAPRLVWNTSASAPLGLYTVRPGDMVARGDMVLARVPGPYRRMAAERHYIPPGVPLVKRVAAGPGDEVCASGPWVFINSKPAAERRAADGQGRPMPVWQGCHRLLSGDYFLLMRDSPASFDGRYFGISRATDIIGPARLIWANPGRD